MDIKQISYFMAVAQEGSFSRAAEKLEVSQPTLSMAVKKLEEELGAELFYSFNRRQNLTDEGLRLKEGAAKLLEVYQETIENVKLSDYVGSGAVTLGLSPLFGACFFGDLIPSFSAAYADQYQQSNRWTQWTRQKFIPAESGAKSVGKHPIAGL